MFCNIIVTRPFNQIFTYKLKKNQSVRKGSIVSIPFGRSKNQIGMVESISNNIILNGDYKIKEIEKVCKKTNIYPKFLFNTLKW